jgi:hypothetical protein
MTAVSAVVQQSFQSEDTYYSSSDDGCIGSDAQIVIKRGTIPMKDVMPGDFSDESKIKWIIRVSNLNHGNPITLYNGLTGSHPVHHTSEGWIKAKYYPGAKVTLTSDIVYDVILEHKNVNSMKVNGIYAAVVGYPIKNMVHPYWGSNKVLDDVQLKYPNGGFVDVDAKQFQFMDGLVSSLFPN